MTVGKQAVDVHTTQLMQMIVAEWMKRYDVDEHIEKIRKIYRRKLNLMCDMIDSGAEVTQSAMSVPRAVCSSGASRFEDVDALEALSKNPPRTWSRSSPALHF